MEIANEGFTSDEEGKEILNKHYEGWDEYDFDKYIRLLKIAAGK